MGSRPQHWFVCLKLSIKDYSVFFFFVLMQSFTLIACLIISALCYNFLTVKMYNRTNVIISDTYIKMSHSFSRIALHLFE